MSDRTPSVPVPQPQTDNPAAEQAPDQQPAGTAQAVPDAAPAAPEVAAPAPAEGAAAAAAEQAKAATEQAEAAEQAAREQAAETLRAVVKAYRAGERAYRQGLLEAGRLAGEYLRQRLALGDDRAAAVQTLEGQLAAWSSSAVDVNRLVACWEAYRLLAVEPGLAAAPKGKPAPADAVPLGHYRDCWCRLVERQRKGTAEESWTLLPRLEEECKAAFAKAVADGLAKAKAEEAVRVLLQQYAARQVAAAADARTRAEADATAKAAEQKQAAEAVAKAAVEADAAKRAAEQASEADRAAMAAEAEVKLAALRQAQQEALARQAAADAAAREAERQRQAAEAAAAKQAAEQAKQERAAARKAPQGPATATAVQGPTAQARTETPDLPTRRPPTLREQAKAGTAKDVAAMAAELVTGAEAPDDVLVELLALLGAHGELSRKAKRACQAALVVLHRKDAPSPSPAEVAAALNPAPNGPPSPAEAAA